MKAVSLYKRVTIAYFYRLNYFGYKIKLLDILYLAGLSFKCNII